MKGDERKGEKRGGQRGVILIIEMILSAGRWAVRQEATKRTSKQAVKKIIQE